MTKVWDAKLPALHHTIRCDDGSGVTDDVSIPPAGYIRFVDNSLN